jgi:NAD(P)-dependent dehydrogenase (short-subunit alcohol dehydrogenase family)
MAAKTALIIGGTGDIGFACAKALALNHHLVLVYRSNHERAKNKQVELLSLFPKATVEILQLDIKSPEDVDTLYARFRGLVAPQVLITCFGRSMDGLFVSLRDEDVTNTFRDHLLIPTWLSRRAVEGMIRTGFGRIVFVGSISAHYVKRGQVPYAAAKAGLEGLTKSLAAEVGIFGVTVNLISAGLIETVQVQDHLNKLGRGTSLKSVNAVGRLGTPEDVARVVAGLCEEASAYITGSVSIVDGGRSLGDYRL